MTNNLLLELAAAYDIEIKAPEYPPCAAVEETTPVSFTDDSFIMAH